MSNLSKTILQAEWGVGQVANFPYPDRSTSTDFASSGHTAVVASMGFSLQDISVSLGASTISVTNNSSRAVPRGEEVYLSLAEADESPVGGQGAGLLQAQVASGADSFAGTNDQNELINKFGERIFKVQIIPRLAPLAELNSLINNTGEITVANDRKALVVLGGYGSNQPYTIYATPGEGGPYYLTGTFVGADQASRTQDDIGEDVSAGVIPYFSVGNISSLKCTSVDISIRPSVVGLDPENGIPIFATDSAGSFIVSDQDGLPVLLLSPPTIDGSQPATFGIFGLASPQFKNTTSGGSRTAVAGGNAVDDNDTFNGGSGQGYTIGQIVRALKDFGFLEE